MAVNPELRRWLAQYDAARKSKRKGMQQISSIVNNTTAVLNAAKSSGLIDQRGYDERLADYQKAVGALSRTPVTRNGIPLTKPNGKPLTHIEFVKNGVYKPSSNLEGVNESLIQRQQQARVGISEPPPSEPVEILKNIGGLSPDVYKGLEGGIKNTALKIQALGETRRVSAPDGKPYTEIRPFTFYDPESTNREQVPFVSASKLAEQVFKPENEAQSVGAELGAGLVDVALNPLSIIGLSGLSGMASKRAAKLGIKPIVASGAVQSIPIVGGIASAITNDPKLNVFDPLSMAVAYKPTSELTQALQQAESITRQQAPMTRAGVNVVGSIYQAGVLGAKGLANEGVASLKKGVKAVRQIKADQIALKKTAAESGLAVAPVKPMPVKELVKSTLDAMDGTGQIPSNLSYAVFNTVPTAIKQVKSMVDPYDPTTGKGTPAPDAGEWLQVLANAAILKPAETSIIAKAAGSFNDITAQAQTIYTARMAHNKAVDGLYTDLPILKTIQDRTGLNKDEAISYLNLWFEKNVGRPISSYLDFPVLNAMSQPKKAWDPRSGVTFEQFQQSKFNDAQDVPFAFLSNGQKRGNTSDGFPPIWDSELLQKVQATKRFDTDDMDDAGMPIPNKHDEAMHTILEKSGLGKYSRLTEKNLARDNFKTIAAQIMQSRSPSKDDVLDEVQKRMQRLQIPEVVTTDENGNVRRLGLDPELQFAVDITDVDAEAAFTIDATTSGKQRTGIDVDAIPKTIKGLSKQQTWVGTIGKQRFVFTAKGFDAGGVYISARPEVNVGAELTRTVLMGRESLQQILPKGEAGMRILNEIETALNDGGNPLQDRVDAVLLDEGQRSADARDFPQSVYINAKKFQARYLGDNGDFYWYQLPSGAVIRQIKTASAGRIMTDKPMPPLTGLSSKARIYGWSASVLDQARGTIPDQIDILLDKDDPSSQVRVHLTDVNQAAIKRMRDNYNSELLPEQSKPAPDTEALRRKYEAQISNYVLGLNRQSDDEPVSMYLGMEQPIKVGDIVLIRSRQEGTDLIRVTPLREESKRAVVVSVGKEGVGVKLAGRFDDPTSLIHSSLLVPAEIQRLSTDDVFNLANLDDEALATSRPFNRSTAEQRKASQEMVAETEARKAVQQEQERANTFLRQFADIDQVFASASADKLSRVGSVEDASALLRQIQSRRRLTPNQYGDIIYTALKNSSLESHDHIIQAVLAEPATDPANTSSVIRQNEALNGLKRWLDTGDIAYISDDATEVLFFSNPVPGNTRIQRELTLSDINTVANYALRTWKTGKLETHIRNVLNGTQAYSRLPDESKKAAAINIATRAKQMANIDIGLGAILQRLPKQNKEAWSYIARLSPEAQIDLLVKLTDSETFFDQSSEVNRSIDTFNTALRELGGQAGTSTAPITTNSYMDVVRSTVDRRSIAARKMLSESAAAYARSNDPATIDGQSVKYFVDNLPEAERVTFVESLLGGLSDGSRKQIGDFLSETTKIAGDLSLKDLIDFAESNKLKSLSDLQNAADALARGVSARIAVTKPKAQGTEPAVKSDQGMDSFNEWFDLVAETPGYFEQEELQTLLLNNRQKYAEEIEQNGFGEFMATFIDDLTGLFKSQSVTPEFVDTIVQAGNKQAVKAFTEVHAYERESMSVLAKIPDGETTGLSNERVSSSARRSDFGEMQEALVKLAEISADNVDTPVAPAVVSKEDVQLMRKSLRETAAWLRQYGNVNISAIDFQLPVPGKGIGGAAVLEGSITEAARLAGDADAFTVGPDGRVTLTKYGATNRVGMAQVFKRTLGLPVNAGDQATALATSISNDLALLWDMNARSYAMRVMDHELLFGNIEAGSFYIRTLEAIRDRATNPNDAVAIDQVIDYVRENNSLIEYDSKGTPKSVIKRVFSGINSSFGDSVAEFLQTHRLAQLTNDFYTMNARLLSGGFDPTKFTTNSNIRGAEAFIHMVYPESNDVSRNVVNMVLHLNRTSNVGRNAYALAHEVTHGLYHTMPWMEKYKLANNALAWASKNYTKLVQGKEAAIQRAYSALKKEKLLVDAQKETLSPDEFKMRYEVDIADRNSVTFTDPVINEIVVSYLTNMALSSPQVFAGSDNYAYGAAASAVFRSIGNRLGAAIRFMNESIDYGAVDVQRGKVLSRWTLSGDTFYSRDSSNVVSHTPLDKGWVVRLAVNDDVELAKYLTPLTSKDGVYLSAGSLTGSSRIDVAATRFASIFNRAFGKNYRDVSVEIEDMVYAPPSGDQDAVRGTYVMLSSPTKQNEFSKFQNINYVKVDQVVDNGVLLKYKVRENGQMVTKSVNFNKGDLAYVVKMDSFNPKTKKYESYRFLMRADAINSFGARVSGYSNAAFSKQSAAVLYSLYGGTKKAVQTLSRASSFDQVATAESMLAASINSDVVDTENILGTMPRGTQEGFNPEDFDDPAVNKSRVNARPQIYKDGIQNEMEWAASLDEGLKDSQGKPESVIPAFIGMQETFNNIRLAMFGGSADGFAQSSGENKTNATFYGRKDSNGYLSTPEIFLVGDARTDPKIGLRQSVASDLLILAGGSDGANPTVALATLAKVAREAPGIQAFIKGLKAVGIDEASIDALTQARLIGKRQFTVSDSLGVIKELLTNNLPFGYTENVNGPINGKPIYDYLSQLTSGDNLNLANVRNQNIILSHVMKRFLDLHDEFKITSMTELLTKLNDPLGKDSTVYRQFVSFAQRMNADAAFRARALREWRNYDLVDVIQARGKTPWLVITETTDATLSAEQRAALATVKKPEGLKPFYAVNPDDGRVVLAERNEKTGAWQFRDTSLENTVNEGTNLYKATAMMSDRAGKAKLSVDEKLFGVAVETGTNERTGEKSYTYPNEVYVYLSPQINMKQGSVLPPKLFDKDNLLVAGSESLQVLTAAMQQARDPSVPGKTQVITIALPHRNAYLNGKVDMTSKFQNLNGLLQAFKNPVPGELVTLRTLEVLWDETVSAWRIRDRGIPFTEDIPQGRKLGLGELLQQDKSQILGISLPEVHISKILAEKALTTDSPLAEKLKSVTGSGRKDKNGNPIVTGRSIASKLADSDETWGLTLFSNGFSQRDIDALRGVNTQEDIADEVRKAMRPDPELDMTKILEEDNTLPEGQMQISVDEKGLRWIKAQKVAADGIRIGAIGVEKILLEADSLIRIAKLSRDLSAMANQSYLLANPVGDIMALARGNRPPMLTSVLLSLPAMAPNLPSFKQSVSNPRHALAQFGDTALGDKMVHLAIDRVLGFMPDLTIEDMQAYGLNLEYLKHYNLFKDALADNPIIRKEDIPLNAKFDDMLGEGHITAIFKKITPTLSAFERTNVLYRDLTKIMAFQDEYSRVMNTGRPEGFRGTDADFQTQLLEDVAWSVNFLGGNDQGEFSNSKNLNTVQSKFSKLFMSAPYTKTRTVLTPFVGHILYAGKQLANKSLEKSGSKVRISTRTEERVLPGLGSDEFLPYAKRYINRKVAQGWTSSIVGPLGWRLLKLLAYGSAIGTVVEASEDKPDKFQFIADTIKDGLAGMMTFEHNGKTYSMSMPGALGRMTRQGLRPLRPTDTNIANMGQFYFRQYFENAISPILGLMKTATSGKDYNNRASFENSLGYRELRKRLLENYRDTPLIGAILKMSPQEMSRFATEIFFTINELSQMEAIEDDIDLQRMRSGEDLYSLEKENFDTLPFLSLSNMIGLNLEATDQIEKDFLEARSGNKTNRTKLKEMRASTRYRNFYDTLRDSGISGVMSGYAEGGAEK